MTVLTSFLMVGLGVLAWQTYHDLKTRTVDDGDARRAWLMQGALIMLVLVTGYDFIVYVAAIILSAIYVSQLKKHFGAGDRDALGWILPGFLIVNLVLPLFFMVSFSGLTIIHFLGRRYLKVRGEVAGFPLILGSFIITAFIAVFGGL